MKAQPALNCAAIRIDNKCNWLTVDKCPGQANCKFFKTKKQKVEAEQNAAALVAELDPKEARYYSIKYYNGEAPREGVNGN